ncbi:hypothetical protein LCGC14_1240030, partial [marine sediment metagenome]
IYTVQYEELVDDFEYESSSLLKFLGLPQEKACSEFYKNSRQVKTASFKQVRTPIYKSSVAAWKNYEQHLQPLINLLNYITDQFRPLIDKTTVNLYQCGPSL